MAFYQESNGGQFADLLRLAREVLERMEREARYRAAEIVREAEERAERITAEAQSLAREHARATASEAVEGSPSGSGAVFDVLTQRLDDITGRLDDLRDDLNTLLSGVFPRPDSGVFSPSSVGATSTPQQVFTSPVMVSPAESEAPTVRVEEAESPPAAAVAPETGAQAEPPSDPNAPAPAAPATPANWMSLEMPASPAASAGTPPPESLPAESAPSEPEPEEPPKAEPSEEAPAAPRRAPQPGAMTIVRGLRTEMLEEYMEQQKGKSQPAPPADEEKPQPKRRWPFS